LVQLAVTAVAEASRDRKKSCMLEGKTEAEETTEDQHSRLVLSMLGEQRVASREGA